MDYLHHRYHITEMITDSLIRTEVVHESLTIVVYILVTFTIITVTQEIDSLILELLTGLHQPCTQTSETH